MKIIHLSDLHFGTEIPELVTAALEDIKAQAADLIIISGDLTQRARTPQFLAAKNFISALPTNTICVPGNHDIALYNLIERFFYPFNSYKHWINSDLCTHYIKDHIAILGINSVTPFKPMSGYVTEKQLGLVHDFFQQQPKDQTRIIMMHHNLIKSDRHKIINDSKKIIDLFASCNINLVLSGHLHLARNELLKQNANQHPMYIITAGTAISTRTREANSYNIINICNNEYELQVKSFLDNQFSTTKTIHLPA